MGKRKRRADLNKTPPPPSSDLMPPPPGMDALTKQKFSRQVDSNGMKPFLTIADIIDPGKVTQGQQSSIVHRRNIDIPKSLRNHRHYGRHYSRRRLASNAETSNSHGGSTPFYDEKLSLKMASKSYSESGHDPAENRQTEIHKPEGAPSSSLTTSVISSGAGRLFCALCQKFLKNEPHIVLDNSLPIYETVAVLACGHLYHADCLERRTNREDRHDPPCPTCLGLVCQVDASVEQD